MSTRSRDDSGSVKDVVRWLHARKRLLLVTHVRPDGDAFGSLLGLLRLLNQAGKWDCTAYLTDGLPERYRTLLGAPSGLRENDIQPDAFDGLVCLDTATWERADLPVSMSRTSPLVPVCNIDHHVDNSRYGEKNWIADCAATAQMILSLANQLGVPVEAPVATPLLSAILTDCGGFRYGNTNAAVLRDAASLIDAGAEYSKIVDRLFLCEPYGRLKLKSELLENAHFAFDRQFAYAVLFPAMLKKHGVEPADTENVVDVLRIIEGVQAACLIQPEEDGVRLSLRARSDEFAVGQIARALGGGGHAMAAGVRLGGVSVEDAIKQLLNQAKDVFSV